MQFIVRRNNNKRFRSGLGNLSPTDHVVMISALYARYVRALGSSIGRVTSIFFSRVIKPVGPKPVIELSQTLI